MFWPKSKCELRVRNRGVARTDMLVAIYAFGTKMQFDLHAKMNLFCYTPLAPNLTCLKQEIRGLAVKCV